MKLGIIGFPASGKTSLFNAVTGGAQPVGQYSNQPGQHLGIMTVPDARLWMATERGIAIFDGRKVRRMDVRRGLVENTVLDVTIDELGRVWARGPRSLMMVTP